MCVCACVRMHVCVCRVCVCVCAICEYVSPRQTLKELEAFTDKAQNSHTMLADLPLMYRRSLLYLTNLNISVDSVAHRLRESAVTQLRERFIPGTTVVVDTPVPLAIRCAALHPRHGHLSSFTPEQRTHVWTAVVNDAVELYSQNHDLPVRPTPHLHMHTHMTHAHLHTHSFARTHTYTHSHAHSHVHTHSHIHYTDAQTLTQDHDACTYTLRHTIFRSSNAPAVKVFRPS